MEISVFLEPNDSAGFRASSLTPTRLVAEAPTREETLARLRDLVVERLGQGEMVRLDVPLPTPSKAHPWKAVLGKLKDHPDAAEVDRNIREYRRNAVLDVDAQ